MDEREVRMERSLPACLGSGFCSATPGLAPIGLSGTCAHREAILIPRIHRGTHSNSMQSKEWTEISFLHHCYDTTERWRAYGSLGAEFGRGILRRRHRDGD